jgi:hypothetical protein
MANIGSTRGVMPGALANSAARVLDGKQDQSIAGATQRANAAQYLKPGSPDPAAAQQLAQSIQQMHQRAQMFVANKLLEMPVLAMPNPASVQLKMPVIASATTEGSTVGSLESGQPPYLKSGRTPLETDMLAQIEQKTANARRTIDAVLGQAPSPFAASSEQ